MNISTKGHEWHSFKRLFKEQPTKSLNDRNDWHLNVALPLPIIRVDGYRKSILAITCRNFIKQTPNIIITTATNLLGILFIAIVFASCTEEKITTKNAEFAAEEDPVCAVVEDLCDDFDIEEGSILENYFDNCDVAISFEKERFMVTSVKVYHNDTKSVLFERNLSKISEDEYETTFTLYNPFDKYKVVEFHGLIFTDDFVDFDEEEFANETANINWKEVEYYNILNAYSFDEIGTGEVKFFKKDSESEQTLYRTVNISESQIVVTDYWKAGQPKLIKNYDKEENVIISVDKYNEDGSKGDQVEVASLINDRWIGFSSDLVTTYGSSRDNVFLVLRTDIDDWHFGKVIVCYSSSCCKQDYARYQQGEFAIEGSNRIRFYNMKNSKGGYADECRFIIEGDSPSNITIRGSFCGHDAVFTSDLDIKNNTWFKNSLKSKFKMY